jgi:hypothetical protein
MWKPYNIYCQQIPDEDEAYSPYGNSGFGSSDFAADKQTSYPQGDNQSSSTGSFSDKYKTNFSTINFNNALNNTSLNYSGTFSPINSGNTWMYVNAAQQFLSGN